MFKRLTALAGGTIVGLGLTLGLAQTAQAGTFHEGWNYSIDAFGDGSGGSVFDIKGLAFKETEDSIYIGISGNTPLTGESYGGAADGNVGWGDLFFNFTGDTFNEANENGDLFAIRFADTNDSGVAQAGVYSDVTAKRVTLDNSGYKSLKHYYSAGRGKFNVADTMGGDLSTRDEVYDYFAGTTASGANHTNTYFNNVIDTGTFQGGIEMLDDQQASDAGLDFSNFNATGDELITFKFDRALLPSAEFIANVFLECGNDGIGIHGEFEDIPEPSAMGGIVLFGMIAGGRYLKKRRQVLA